MILSSSPGQSQPRSIRCSVEGCVARFCNVASLRFHEKYYHINGQQVKDAKDGHDNEGKKGDQFYCREGGCMSTNKDGRLFKSFSNFKQHYMAAHATKIYECQRCGKKFSILSRLKQHELTCGLKFVCSCGIAYSGTRGLIAHVKLSGHKPPDAAKIYLMKKQEKVKDRSSVKKVNRKKAKNKKVKGIRNRGPIPILPKGNLLPQTVYIAKPNIVSPPSIIRTEKCYSTHNSYSCNSSSKPVNLQHRRRIVIDVLTPQKNPEVQQQCNTQTPLPATKEMDSLSSAMLSSGIKSCVSGKPTELANDGLSKKSQTDRPVSNLQQGQDFSCQTEEFLSWLDSENVTCSHLAGSSTATICTQTMQSLDSSEKFMNFHAPDCAPSRNVAQTETQTDDDWINSLFHDDAVLTVGSQSVVHTSDDIISSSSYCNVLPELSCNIQTQTNFMDSTAHVTTQTGFGTCMDSSQTDFDDPVLSYIVSDNQTQTDTANHVSVETAHTQTSYSCDDIVQLFNIQTQTDMYMDLNHAPMHGMRM